MTTVLIEDNCVQADRFVEYIRTLPFVKVVEEKKTYLEPDDDFHRAISAEEFLERALVIVDKLDKVYLDK